MRLRPYILNPAVVSASWTIDCTPVATIPFPWQRWEGTFECPVIDIIPSNPTIPDEGVLIMRQVALSPTLIPLQNLRVQDPMILELDWMQWDEFPEPLNPPGVPPDELRLEIETTGEGAALVMYTVTGQDGTEYLVFISEAELSPGPSPTDESTWGRIKSFFK